jgi:hypothetical protein
MGKNRLCEEGEKLLSLRYFEPEYLKLKKKNQPTLANLLLQSLLNKQSHDTSDNTVWQVPNRSACPITNESGIHSTHYTGYMKQLLLFCPSIENTCNNMMKLTFEVAIENEYIYHRFKTGRYPIIN